MRRLTVRFLGSVLLIPLIMMVLHTGVLKDARATGDNRKTDAQRWEYLAIQYQNIEDLVSKANAAGKEGWELAIIGTCNCGVTGVAYLKRRSP